MCNWLAEYEKWIKIKKLCLDMFFMGIGGIALPDIAEFFQKLFHFSLPHSFIDAIRFISTIVGIALILISPIICFIFFLKKERKRKKIFRL